MNIQSNGERMKKAQKFRYSKINHLIQYLQGTNNAWLIDELVEDSKLTAFCVGKFRNTQSKKRRFVRWVYFALRGTVKGA